MSEWKTLATSFENNGRVLRVRLNRPDVRNAFNEVLIHELKDIFSRINTDSSGVYEKIRAVVLSGEGSAFCGGGDLNWMKKSLQLTEAENLDDCQKLSHMFHTLDTCRRPLIGLVHGYAIGGGVGLVSICDHVIAAEDTVFSLSEVKLGLIPACIGPFVISKIGPSQARSLFLSGERFTSQKAQAISLVHEVCAKDDLEKHCQKVLGRVLEGGPHAIEAAKYLIHTLSRDLVGEEFETSMSFASGELARLRVQPEAQEGLKAFLEKRSPSWRNG